MTTIFEYTDFADTDNSSFVDFVHYNSNDNSVAIEFTDDVYVYDGVSESDYRALVEADSVGAHYNTVFKHRYGPGTHLGSWKEVEYEEAKQVVSTPTTPKGLNFDTAETPTKEYSLASVSPIRSEPVLLDDVKVDEPTREFSLAPVGSRVASTTDGNETYEVIFNGGRSFTPKGNITSVDDAVWALNEIGDMLDVEVKVEKVVVTFE